MEKRQVQQLTEQLLDKKRRLEAELNKFAKKDPRVKGDWDSAYPRVPEGNLEEAADEVEEYSTRLNVEFSLENQLKEVNGALARLEEGTYGACANCGKTIPAERLAASPEARLCTTCNE